MSTKHFNEKMTHFQWVQKKSAMWAAVFALMAGTVPAGAWAQTISVMGGGCNPIGAIQAAIDSATNGDVIDVYPGVYVENIDFKGKQIVVQSHSNNPSDTIIDGGKKGSVVIFNKGETPATVLQGFTLRNGKASAGGGIYIRGLALFADGTYHASNPTLKNLVIRDNSATLGGGVFMVNNTTVSIGNNSIKMEQVDILNNQASAEGGGFYSVLGPTDWTSGKVSGNSAKNGGGVYLTYGAGYYGGRSKFNNVQITNNVATGQGGGIFTFSTYLADRLYVDFSDVTITGNAATEGSGAYCKSKADSGYPYKGYTIFTGTSGVVVNNNALTGGSGQQVFMTEKCSGWGNVIGDSAKPIVELIAEPLSDNCGNSICTGSTFNVVIKAKTAMLIDGAELALKFDKSQLKVNSITNSGVFDTVLDSKYDNTTGDIAFTAGAWNKPAATSLFDLFTINFTALSSTAGTTLLDFVNDSILLTSGGQAVTTTATDQTLTLNQCLNYRVNLQRANAKGDPSWMTPMKVSLGSASAVEYNTTCDVNGLGMLILSKPVVAGDYICVKNSHTLANKVIQPFGNPVDFSTLLEGDAKNDNTVDLLDFSFATTRKGCKGAAGTQYDPQADFDVSTCVDDADKALIVSNYKKNPGCNKNNGLRKGEREIRDGDRQTIGLSATALPDDLKVGDSFSYTIQVNANETQPADGAALYLNFDPTQLRVNQVTTGSSFDVTLENTFDNNTGEINVAAGVWDKSAPTTAVDLVTINFTALQAGEHTITFSHSPERETVITHAGEDVTGTTENGQIVVKPISTTEETVTCPLYGVQDQGLNDSILFTINSESKQVLPLGETCTGCDIEALDIQPVTNVPYLASGNDARQHPNGHLYKLNTQTGELISVGNTGFKDISSLAFDKQGILWAWAKDAGLVKLDTGTGEGTVVIASSAAFADLTWNTEGTTLYGAIGTELWSYTPATDTVTQVCDNLPEKTEAIRVLPTVILPKGFLLLGAHKDDSLKLHAFDTETCQLVAEADILIPYDDVEGLAMPPAPCTMIK